MPIDQAHTALSVPQMTHPRAVNNLLDGPRPVNQGQNLFVLLAQLNVLNSSGDLRSA